MEYLHLKVRLADLEAEADRIKQQTYYQNVWIGECRPAGTARGNVSTQYQLRAHQPIFNGKKSRYLQASQVAECRAAIERGKKLAQLQKEIEKLQRELVRIESMASKHGLCLPKLTSFEKLFVKEYEADDSKLKG